VKLWPVGYDSDLSALSDVLGRVDAFQRGHRATAFGYAVVKKYGDDRGGYLAALIAYYGFLSIFPLLLAFFTVAAWALAGHGGTLHTLEVHLGSYPIIGQAVTSLAKHTLSGSILALVVGVIGLVFGAQGLAQSLMYAMDEIWNVPVTDRPGYLPRLLRGLGWYAAFGVGAVASTFLNSLGSVFDWGPLGPVLAALPALVVNVALFTMSFRVLSPKAVPVRTLLPGAAFGGLVWTILNGVGVGLTHRLTNVNPLYGSFAGVLGLIAFIYLTARLTLYAAEANAVRANHLWPRSLVKAAPSAADRRQVVDLAKREARRDDASVTVEFAPSGAPVD
jgi:YihY family inner membrane protein